MSITPERIAELRAAHEATSFPWCVEGCTVFLDAGYPYSQGGPVSICSASGANNAKTIAAARNALPDLLDETERLRKALSLETHKVITCGVAATHPDKDLVRTKKCYAETWNSPQADAVQALRNDRDRLRTEVERLRALLPKAFSAGVASMDGDVALSENDRDTWVAKALEGKC